MEQKITESGLLMTVKQEDFISMYQALQGYYNSESATAIYAFRKSSLYRYIVLWYNDDRSSFDIKEVKPSETVDAMFSSDDITADDWIVAYNCDDSTDNEEELYGEI